MSDNFIEPMEEESAEFDNQKSQHQISRSGATWHEPMNNPAWSTYSNYSELFKVLSNVELQTSSSKTNSKAYNAEKGLNDGDATGGKRKHNEEETSSAPKSKKSENDKGRRRQRCPETHNMLERRRRDHIKSKMKELQELIPNCYQANRAAMLDEAIRYLKSLKQQVQIMTLGASASSPLQYNMSMGRYQNMPIPNFAEPMPILPTMNFDSFFGTVNGSSPAAIPVIPVQRVPVFPPPGFIQFSPSQLQLNPLPVPSHQLGNFQARYPFSVHTGFPSQTQPNSHNRNMSTLRQSSIKSSSLRRPTAKCGSKDCCDRGLTESHFSFEEPALSSNQ